MKRTHMEHVSCLCSIITFDDDKNDDVNNINNTQYEYIEEF